MKTLEKVKSEILALAEKRVKIEKTGFFHLWQLKNDKATLEGEDKIINYVEKQKELGFSEDDLVVEAYTSTHNAWFTWIAVQVRNPINETYLNETYQDSRSVLWQNRRNFTKTELEEADAPLLAMIKENRKKFIGNKDACIEFINAGNFYQNNFKKMNFDQETHDAVLAVKKQLEENEEEAKKAAQNEIRTWASENGSDFLKLRVKHNQNWMTIAQTEWALAHSKGFKEWTYDDDNDNWPVNNATLEQLKKLESAQAENPNHTIEIYRFKWLQDYDEPEHRTFLTCDVKTPTGTITLFQEIEDADDE